MSPLLPPAHSILTGIIELPLPTAHTKIKVSGHSPHSEDWNRRPQSDLPGKPWLPTQYELMSLPKDIQSVPRKGTPLKWDKDQLSSLKPDGYHGFGVRTIPRRQPVSEKDSLLPSKK